MSQTRDQRPLPFRKWQLIDTTTCLRFVVFRYTVSNATSDSSFAVDSVSGELTTVGPIDRENRTAYRLTVVAENAGYQLSSSADVIVRVVDANDNSPTLLQPETICVSRSTSRGQTVGRLEATDVDEGLNAVLKFRWTSNDDEDVGILLFQLSRDDGIVTAKTDMRAYEGRHFRFRVTMEDLGVTARSAFGTVSIVVNETCAVADLRQAATPEQVADDNWHSAVMVLVVSALFGTTLGFSIVAISACRRRRCVNLLGTMRSASAFSRRVSTPLESARSHAFRCDAKNFSMQQKLRFVVSDDVAEITVVSYCYF